MDEQSVRQQLAETTERLKRVEEEREILLNLVHGFEGWLRLNGAALPTAKAALSVHSGPRVHEWTAKGSISLRGAVRKVLEDAHGAPLHTKEIYARAAAMGAVTTAANPESVTDLTIYSLSKQLPALEKVAPRTWRWAPKVA